MMRNKNLFSFFFLDYQNDDFDISFGKLKLCEIQEREK